MVGAITTVGSFPVSDKQLPGLPPMNADEKYEKMTEIGEEQPRSVMAIWQGKVKKRDYQLNMNNDNFAEWAWKRLRPGLKWLRRAYPGWTPVLWWHIGDDGLVLL